MFAFATIAWEVSIFPQTVSFSSQAEIDFRWGTPVIRRGRDGSSPFDVERC